MKRMVELAVTVLVSLPAVALGQSCAGDIGMKRRRPARSSGADPYVAELV